MDKKDIISFFDRCAPMWDAEMIKDDSIIDADELPDPIESGEEAIAQLEEAVDLLKSVVRELKALSSEE